MYDVPAYREIESTVRSLQFVNALVLESQPWRQVCIAGSREIQVLVNDVHSEYGGLWKKLRQPRGTFPGAATRIQYPGVGRQGIPPE